MRIAVLDCGAVVCKEGEQEWLFGAPEGVAESLKEAGIDTPKVTFLTTLRASGYGKLEGKTLRFKEQRFAANGLEATPVQRKHGTDYTITSVDAKILFSERGDVSLEDVDGYDLAIIRNKHRCNEFGDNVITWPWPNTELDVTEHKLVAVDADTEKILVRGKTLRDDLKSYDDAFRKQFPQADKTVGQWVDDVDDVLGIAYVFTVEGNYAVPYTIGVDGEITYAPKAEWKCARQSWTTVTKDEEVLVREKVIRKEGDKWVLFTKDGKKKLGEFDSEDAAKKRERQIQFFKHQKDDGSDVEDLDESVSIDELGDKKEKEMTAEGPVRRLGDAFTAALHTAYNDFADRYFSEGFMNQDERMVLGAAIGKGLDAVQKEIPSDLYDRPLDKALEVPTQLKELAPNMPDTILGGWSTVYKEGDQWRWATVSSTAVWDLQQELFPPEAMDWALGLAKVVGAGPLRFKHIPGLDGGECDHQVRVGDFLFESGYFYDSLLGLAMKEKLDADPGWKISVGLAFGKDDLIGGRYKRAAIFERSMTKSPANPFTSTLAFGGITMKQLSETELKAVADELGLDLEYVKDLHGKALAGGQSLGLKEFKEYAVKQDKKDKKAEDEDEEEMVEEEETTEKDLKAAISDLDSEQRKALRNMLNEAEKEEVKSDPEVLALKEQVGQLTSAVTQLVAGLQEKKEKGLKDAVKDYFDGTPRRQAKQFASQQEETVAPVNDAAILAKLKELESILKTQPDPMSQVYKQFTSKTLNRTQGVQ